MCTNRLWYHKNHAETKPPHSSKQSHTRNAKPASTAPVIPYILPTSLAAAPVKVGKCVVVMVGAILAIMVVLMGIVLMGIALEIMAVLMLLGILAMLDIVEAMPLIGTSAAAALYAARVLLLPACSLMTMAMPPWQ